MMNEVVVDGKNKRFLPLRRRLSSMSSSLVVVYCFVELIELSCLSATSVW